LIFDFEQIHFHSSPDSLYPSFAGFLEHQAAGYYPEETEETAHARPDAVRIMTVHQAKGMQWPAGRSIWSIIPDEAIPNADRYKGTKEDERRLLYVALTRAEEYLFCSWGPIPDNQQQRRVSECFTELTQTEFVLGADPEKAPPRFGSTGEGCRLAPSLDFQ
jgi:DNA helicase-2/ATP-dependent DNA helicase PcrA